jgi:hypothetical protein
MTPKEKAEELFNKFYPRATSYSSDRKNQNENAKQCALIAVDEIIKAIPCREDYGGDGWVLIENTEYWIEVKDELEKL